MPKKTLGFCALCAVTSAMAATLHYGADQITLSPSRPTSPALAVGMGNGVYYGALYSDTAPGGTLHVGSYWLGQYCPGGKYTSDGRTPCTDCGIGYYCTGNRHRASCTYGVLGCPGASHSVDGALPAGAPVNQFMELADVNAFIPPTDIGQWKLLSWDASWGGPATADDPNTINDPNATKNAGVIGPGTYLFVAHYTFDYPGYSDSITGADNTTTTAQIAVFDHPVGYRAVHGDGIFQFFIDINHAPFESWTISSTPIGQWNKNINATNVSGITHFGPLYLAVYELQ